MIPYGLAARALHLLPPEDAHLTTLALLRAGLGPLRSADAAELAVELPHAGGVLRFPNCVGLAAGFDKNAEVPDAMLRAGFGFVECGTVTPRPQEGNPRPRLFRLSEDRAVINRMGFNNGGLDRFAASLSARTQRLKGLGPVGLNIGANKDSDDREGDYVTGLRRLWGMGDYFTVNISSPNTPGLRALQGRAALDGLLGRLAEARTALSAATGTNFPVFLKIAPDLVPEDIADTVESALAHGLEGMIVSNTTLSRAGLTSPLASEAGGLSGEPVFEISTEALKVAYGVAKGRLMLIGAGGVGSADQAWAKIRAGASLVQLYSALVYRGPGLVGEIVEGLRRTLRSEGLTHVSQAVGQG